MGEYYRKSVTADGNDWIDWKLMASSSRFLANSSVAYLEDVFYKQQLHKIVYASGCRGSQAERDLFDGLETLHGFGGGVVKIPEEHWPALLRLGEAVVGVKNLGRNKKEHDGVEYVHSDVTCNFVASVKDLMGDDFVHDDDPASLEKVGELIMKSFNDLFDVASTATGGNHTSGQGASRSSRTVTVTEMTTGLLRSRGTRVQGSHADFKFPIPWYGEWPEMWKPPRGIAAIGFLGLAKTGTALLLWIKGKDEVEEGIIILVSFGEALIVPMYCLHAGGFAICCDETEKKSNPRMHFYFDHGTGAQQTTNHYFYEGARKIDIATRKKEPPYLKTLISNRVFGENKYKEPKEANKAKGLLPLLWKLLLPPRLLQPRKLKADL
jgi:hypothetical protein